MMTLRTTLTMIRVVLSVSSTVIVPSIENINSVISGSPLVDIFLCVYIYIYIYMCVCVCVCKLVKYGSKS